MFTKRYNYENESYLIFFNKNENKCILLLYFHDLNFDLDYNKDTYKIQNVEINGLNFKRIQ